MTLFTIHSLQKTLVYRYKMLIIKLRLITIVSNFNCLPYVYDFLQDKTFIFSKKIRWQICQE